MAKKPIHHRNVPTFIVVCILVTAIVAAIFVGGYIYRTANGYQTTDGVTSVQGNKKNNKNKNKKQNRKKKNRCIFGRIGCMPTTTPTPSKIKPEPSIIVDPSCAFMEDGCEYATPSSP